MAIVTPISIDEDIWEDVWDEERSWREDRPDREQIPEPLALVIFGATGDLTHRYLVPALYSLTVGGFLPKEFAIIGFGRSRQELDEFRGGLRQTLADSGVDVEDAKWDDFASRISYVRGRYDDEGSFDALSIELDRVDREMGCGGHHLFYLSTPPNVYREIVKNLGASGLNRPRVEGGWVRIIVEKPFGRDLDSAAQLDRCVHEVFDEEQIYRIDHYLGKETVQNMFVLRFVNGIFEPIWNRNFIDHVQITVSESIGVEARGGYYEQAGATRDMLQSHLLQLLSLTAMEPPSAFTADKVRDEKVKVLDALHFPEGEDVTRYVVRSQYGRGMVDGRRVPGYHDEAAVDPHSRTETFVAAMLMVDNWRWAGVPFFLRTGKRLPKRVSEIAIEFRRAPHTLLDRTIAQRPRRNVLVLRIQPDDGLALRLDVKVPGPTMRVRPVDMSFLYKDAFGGESPDAYERLLLDAMRGDGTLFARSDEVEEAWALVTPVLIAWTKDQDSTIPVYPAGSWGPEEAEQLLAPYGHRWRRP
jgi:glucose-6-phosphate 1-dehydrogenase